MKKGEKKGKAQASCRCPYCETEVMEMSFPFCKACGKKLLRCTTCLTVIEPGTKICPSCGRTQ